MVPNATIAAELKAKCAWHTRAHAKALCANKGIYGEMADAMANGMKPPLIGFTDGFDVHFVGEDADKVAGILGKPVLPDPDGTHRFSVDTRVWNDVIDLLAQHSLTVSMTDVPADTE